MAKISPRSPRRIAFQGQPGAYSDLACRHAYPGIETLPCASFEDAFAAVRNRRAELAMIPVENSVAGRVADVHALMPQSETAGNPGVSWLERAIRSFLFPRVLPRRDCPTSRLPTSTAGR